MREISLSDKRTAKKSLKRSVRTHKAHAGSPIPKRGFTFHLVTFLVTLQEQTPQPLIGQIFDR